MSVSSNAQRVRESARLVPMVLLALALLAGGGQAQQPENRFSRGDELVQLDFKDVELTVVIETIARITGRNFIYDDRVRGREGANDIITAGRELDEKLIDFEMNLTDLRMSGGSAGQDRLRWPRQLYAKITSLAGSIGGSDFAPTTQQTEVHERLKDLLREYQAQMQTIREQDIATFNRMLSESGLAGVIVGGNLSSDIMYNSTSVSCFISLLFSSLT